MPKWSILTCGEKGKRVITMHSLKESKKQQSKKCACQLEPLGPRSACPHPHSHPISGLQPSLSAMPPVPQRLGICENERKKGLLLTSIQSCSRQELSGRTKEPKPAGCKWGEPSSHRMTEREREGEEGMEREEMEVVG